jgi:hypothetical protein
MAFLSKFLKEKARRPIEQRVLDWEAQIRKQAYFAKWIASEKREWIVIADDDDSDESDAGT